jgi:hypothetical protein
MTGYSLDLLCLPHSDHVERMLAKNVYFVGILP